MPPLQSRSMHSEKAASSISSHESMACMMPASGPRHSCTSPALFWSLGYISIAIASERKALGCHKLFWSIASIDWLSPDRSHTCLAKSALTVFVSKEDDPMNTTKKWRHSYQNCLRYGRKSAETATSYCPPPPQVFQWLSFWIQDLEPLDRASLGGSSRVSVDVSVCSSGCGHSNRVTPVLSRYRQAEVWFEEFFFLVSVFLLHLAQKVLGFKGFDDLGELFSRP